LKLIDLENAVRTHAGEFLCLRIHDEDNTKIVHFSHVLTSPIDTIDIPAIGRLQDFYDTFGSIVFYYDEKSGDAAKQHCRCV